MYKNTQQIFPLNKNPGLVVVIATTIKFKVYTLQDLCDKWAMEINDDGWGLRFRNFKLIGRLTKDQEVTDIWPVSELLNAYINVFFVKFET